MIAAKHHALLLVFAAGFTLHADPAPAQEANSRWAIRADLQGFFNSYSGSTNRDMLTNAGVFVHADYFERAGFSLGYSRTVVDGRPGFGDLHQDNRFVSARYSLTPDSISGRLTLRVDKYSVSNADDIPQASSNGGSNGVGVGPGPGAGTNTNTELQSVTGTGSADTAAVQVSYLNFSGTFYWDVGVAQSDYDDLRLDGRALRIDQVTPTIGLGFNELRDWLQLRAYLIDASIPALAQGEGDTVALEVKWTHWPLGGGVLGLENYRFALMAGDRVFAADPDAGSLFNLAERQTAIISVGGEWALTERSRALVLIGSESYENTLLGTDYRSTFLLLNFSHRWE